MTGHGQPGSNHAQVLALVQDEVAVHHKPIRERLDCTPGDVQIALYREVVGQAAGQGSAVHM